MIKRLLRCYGNNVHNENVTLVLLQQYSYYKVYYGVTVAMFMIKWLLLCDSNYVRNEVIWCYSSDIHVKKFIMVL